MTDTNNLVARLRLFGSSAVEREAADEIERLSNELKNADEVCKTITELQERVKTLTGERDVAQRYICGLSWEDSRDMAKQLGWDCFKDQNE